MRKFDALWCVETVNSKVGQFTGGKLPEPTDYSVAQFVNLFGEDGVNLAFVKVRHETAMVTI